MYRLLNLKILSQAITALNDFEIFSNQKTFRAKVKIYNLFSMHFNKFFFINSLILLNQILNDENEETK